MIFSGLKSREWLKTIIAPSLTDELGGRRADSLQFRRLHSDHVVLRPLYMEFSIPACDTNVHLQGCSSGGRYEV